MMEIVNKQPVLSKDFFNTRFGDWWPKIEPFFDRGGFEPIYSRLKEDSRDNRVITPLSRYTFECFIATPLSELKVVMMGMSPYHTRVNNILVADGLLMSSSTTGICPPSLEQYYDGIEEEYKGGLCVPCERWPDLHWLARQGVLMFNASLTTELYKAGSHLELWRDFTKYIFEEVIAITGVPVIFLGKEAEKFKRYLGPMQWSFKVSHPASASYRGEKWDTEGVFTKVDKILHDSNGTSIAWIMGGLPF